jgi:hypothetical protein
MFIGELIMVLVWGLTAALPIGFLLAAFLTSRVVEYVETITINGKIRDVYDAIRFQERLMEWSAWSSETGSACALHGTDGELGAQTVFMHKNGTRFGYQEISALTENQAVSFMLKSKGPPQKPQLHFHLSPVGDGSTRVILHFLNEITPPFHLILRIAGIVRWTRHMHGKDLGGLKRYIEQRETYQGEQARAA